MSETSSIAPAAASDLTRKPGRPPKLVKFVVRSCPESGPLSAQYMYMYCALLSILQPLLPRAILGFRLIRDVWRLVARVVDFASCGDRVLNWKGAVPLDPLRGHTILGAPFRQKRSAASSRLNCGEDAILTLTRYKPHSVGHARSCL